MSETNHVIVIGAGAAGMLAAIAAAREGAAVELWEQNEKPGKKLFITGKGRCNVTNVLPPPMPHGLWWRAMTNDTPG